jgi:hypothetical protein
MIVAVMVQASLLPAGPPQLTATILKTAAHNSDNKDNFIATAPSCVPL